MKNTRKVKVKNNESLNSALRRFNRNLKKIGVMKECRDNQFYKKPSEERREARKKAEKRRERSRIRKERRRREYKQKLRNIFR